MATLSIGGVFFRSSDPAALKAWYDTHLGLPQSPPWMTAGGPVVFEPFPDDTDYFPQDRAFMINFRVDDLDGLVARLVAAGIPVESREEWNSPIGRFVRIADPEGNPIELWEMADGLEPPSE